MSNRTTKERFQNKARKVKDENDNSLENSVMTMNDIDNSSLIESVVDDNTDNKKIKTPRKSRSSNCCINCWKMSTKTKLVPQSKLYNYLAEQSVVIRDSEIPSTVT